MRRAIGSWMIVVFGAGVLCAEEPVGTLMFHGGGTVSTAVRDRFFEYAGGKDAHIIVIPTADTDTLGRARIFFRDAGVARPLAMDFMVVPSQVYDSLIAGSDTLEADAVAISGDATAADNLEAGLEGVVTGTVSTGSTTTVVTTGLSETTDDHYNGRVVVFRSGNLTGQAATITDYNGSTKALTVSTLTEAPGNGDTFVIV